MIEYLINLIDKIRGTRQYRIYKFKRLTGIHVDVKTHREAMEFWDAHVDESDYCAMVMERIHNNGAKTILRSIKEVGYEI